MENYNIHANINTSYPNYYCTKSNYDRMARIEGLIDDNFFKVGGGPGGLLVNDFVVFLGTERTYVVR